LLHKIEKPGSGRVFLSSGLFLDKINIFQRFMEFSDCLQSKNDVYVAFLKKSGAKIILCLASRAKRVKGLSDDI